MHVTLRPYYRFRVQYALTNNAGGDITTRCGPDQALGLRLPAPETIQLAS